MQVLIHREKDKEYGEVMTTIIIPITPLEHHVCFGYLASYLGYFPGDMIPFVSDERGRWRPEETAARQSFLGAFVISDVANAPYAMVKYEDVDGTLHDDPINVDSNGMGVAQRDYWNKYVDLENGMTSYAPFHDEE